MHDPFDIPQIPLRGISLRKMIPDSPFLRLGNQLRLRYEWRRLMQRIPVAPDANMPIDGKEH